MPSEHEHPPRTLPTRQPGFMGLFKVACASCGKLGMRTISGKHHSADGGYCRNCGVFVGFECAGKAGWMGWTRTCPACGRGLKTNSLLFWGVYLGTFMSIMGLVFMPLGLDMLEQSKAEKAIADMPLSYPSSIVDGKEVKLSGTIFNCSSTPIAGQYVGSGEDSYWYWTVEDFSLNTPGGAVRVHAQELSGRPSGTPRHIVGSDGYHGDYKVGDELTVVGVASVRADGITVKADHIAATSSAFLRSSEEGAYFLVFFGFFFYPLLILSLAATRARYRSHWAKAEEHFRNTSMQARTGARPANVPETVTLRDSRRAPAPAPSVSTSPSPSYKQPSVTSGQTALVHCPKCQSLLLSDDRKCPSCGHRL